MSESSLEDAVLRQSWALHGLGPPRPGVEGEGEMLVPVTTLDALLDGLVWEPLASARAAATLNAGP